MSELPHGAANDPADAGKAPLSARARAEQRLGSKAALPAAGVADLAPDQVQALLHELRVHQIELEMQNEELRDAQAALDIVRERYFDLYDLAPVGYCTISEGGIIVQTNLTAASLLGMARNGLLNQPFSRRIHQDDQDNYYLHRKCLLDDGAPQTFELRLRRLDDTVFWAGLTMTVTHDGDGVAEMRVVLTDIAARKQAEAERAVLHLSLEQNNRELERAVSTADKANLAKSDFLSGMSHELRTPLHAILGFAQLLKQPALPLAPEQLANLEQILKAGWHLLKLVDEILDLAAVESGRLDIVLEPVMLAEVLNECAGMVEPMAQQRGLELAVPADMAGRWVMADRTLLKQTLINLLSNAIKYNRASGRVTVTVAPGIGQRLRVGVANTGEGLTPLQVGQLFQPFNRLGQQDGKEGGTGIGLVVSKRLVELMGGQIGVHSRPGSETVFWIELDVAVPLAAPAPPAAVPAAPPADATAAPMRTLLYVEDNAANLMLVEAIIGRQPTIRLLTAANGAAGLALARLHRPDLILMDVNLPDISGIDVLHRLAADAATAAIPVIALSANAMAGDIERGLREGFAHYLTKPIKIDELLKVLGLGLH